jgi:cell division protein FtsB
MSALQRPREQFDREQRQVLPLQPKRRRRYSYSALLLETFFKVLVNGVLSVAAIAALSDLLPHLQSNRAKLREIRARVKEAETQVEQLRDKFSHTFDPGQAKSVMQEQSARIDPNQRRVVLVNKNMTANPATNSPPSEASSQKNALFEPGE